MTLDLERQLTFVSAIRLFLGFEYRQLPRKPTCILIMTNLPLPVWGLPL